MDYKAIYYRIIEKAKGETENGNRSVGYFEKHHIQPKSLGGTNDKENLVKLTAREHFICHWLLVKMYDKGTTERYKMLCALWRMNNHGAPDQKEHYINSRVYEKLRIEFAKAVSEVNSINQLGNKNSQFGTKWYTNRNTGESKKFKEKPIEEFWIEGRNLFNGQTSKIRLNGIKEKCKLLKQDEYLNLRKETFIKKAKQIWNEYHTGNYKSIREYKRITGYNPTKLFEHYIPIFKKIQNGNHYTLASNKNLINVYNDC